MILDALGDFFVECDFHREKREDASKPQCPTERVRRELARCASAGSIHETKMQGVYRERWVNPLRPRTRPDEREGFKE